MSADDTEGAVTLYQHLAAVASADCGSRVAISNATSSMTYEGLIELAGRFCSELESAGVRPFDPVAVILRNSRQFLVAMFGMWKLGAVPVPLNPQLQEAELRKYAKDSGFRAVVTAARNSQLPLQMQANGAGIDHVWLCPSEADSWIYRGPACAKSIAAEIRLAHTGAIKPDHPAITQYSTGSTGTPRRIMRTHRQLLGEFHSVSGVLKVTPADRILGVAPFFHSHGLMNAAMLALLSGAALYPVDTFFPRDVARMIEREALTGFAGVPFMFQLLSDLQERYDFSSLRFALSAGASLPQSTARDFQKKYSIRIRQLYGSTETGVICIHCADDVSRDPNCVGSPIPGVRVRIVDDSCQPVPHGRTGMLQIVSPFAAIQYDDAAQTRESYFTDCSFLPGDLGELSGDGLLTLRGRRRGFINVSGNKVDPAEVEAALLGIPGIVEAAVLGVPDPPADEKIKAVLVAAAGVSQSMLRLECVTRLPEFKRPKVIEFRHELPRSPLGKVLRKCLLDEAGHSQVKFDPFSLPRFATLPPFLRVLLATDGTVTRSLEAYFWEPIEVDILTHSYVNSDASYRDIDVEPGDEVLLRRVVLRGEFTRSAYVFAETVINTERVSLEMKRKLIEERRGIGELLLEGKEETYRELVSVRQTTAGAWATHLGITADDVVFVRKYMIFIGKRASYHIEEAFALARFA